VPKSVTSQNLNKKEQGWDEREQIAIGFFNFRPYGTIVTWSIWTDRSDSLFDIFADHFLVYVVLLQLL